MGSSSNRRLSLWISGPRPHCLPNVLFTRADILVGQGVFLRNGLMEYGSIFGHGAYLGPDYTADYLHRAALIVRDLYGGAESDRAQAQTISDFKRTRTRRRD